MSDIAARLDKWQEERVQHNARLAGMGFSEVRNMDGGGLPFVVPKEYVTCQTCGAMVALGDSEPTDDGRMIERGIRLHGEWHERGSHDPS